MENSARIIKGSNVKLEGTFRLDTGMPRSSAAKEPPVSSASQAAQGVQARIIESNPQYAIIEVVCTCGTRTQIRCEY
jgi:hypothetical protein